MPRKPMMVAAILLLTLTACTDQKPAEKKQPERRASSMVVQAPEPPAIEPPPTKQELKKKPNVVEILADDMRWDDLRYAPNLRKLVAKRGIFMANAFSNYPLCCPARASFFSGQLTHNHHVYGVSKPYGYRAFDDRKSLATSMKQAGYSTGFIGKYLNNYGEDEALGPKLDWEEMSEADRKGDKPEIASQYYVPAGWDEWRAGLQGNFCSPACGGSYHYFKYAWSENGVPTTAKRGQYSSDVMGEQAQELVDKFTRKREKRDKPFFLSLNFIAPHNGSARPEEDPYKEEFMAHPCAVGGPAAPPYAYENKLVRSVKRGAGVRRNGRTEDSTEDKPRAGSRYKTLSKCELEGIRNSTTMRAASVYAMDNNIGELIRQLKENGEWRRTVFIFWSDNGYFQGEHNRPAGKILAYEPSLRVPMLITGPGMRAKTNKGVFGGEDRYTPIDVIDLTATILDFANAVPPRAPDGVTRKGILLKGDESGQGWAMPVVTEAVSTVLWRPTSYRDPRFAVSRGKHADPRNNIGVRTSRYLYVRYPNFEWELYDLWNDPNQWFNLARNGRWKKQNRSIIDELDRTWAKARNCKGVQCKQVMPIALRVSHEQNQRATRAWYAQMRRQYGY